MTQEPRHILVIGAGVIGSVYAARLQAAGYPFTLLARGQHAADLRANGLCLDYRVVNRGEVGADLGAQLVAELREVAV